ncbi:hypothetical protein [Arcobacter porcinus]|uniref:Uncharacterized protein n=1 Tax=Arcobacter porcinus TaxID=1935204 RepID=A0A5C2HBV7_9BACT|nr:hypothetical protein [Arcobacter porcinus]OCL91385.1 hypothetical protein AAX27_01332 [Aliarcobacter thereius]QEP40299.1 hypothetical protein APORC_0684 [Arcobacter porcinus]
MKVLNVGDKVLLNCGLSVLVERVNRTTFLGRLDNDELQVYFLKQIEKKIYSQNSLDLEFFSKKEFEQLSLF